MHSVRNTTTNVRKRREK